MIKKSSLLTMAQINYTRITYQNIKNVLRTTFDHCSGHVYPLVKRDTKFFVVLGHNSKFKNVASFGGFSEQYEGSDTKESLLETITREYKEESLGCITDKKTMKQKLLETNALVTRQSQKGHHYTAFCFLENFDFNDACSKFNQIRKDPNSNLMIGQLENDYLVLVPLENIKKDVVDNPPNLTTSDHLGNQVTVRDINVPVYKWLFSSDFLLEK